MFSVLTYSKENEGIEMKTEKRRNFIRLKKRRKEREERRREEKRGEEKRGEEKRREEKRKEREEE